MSLSAVVTPAEARVRYNRIAGFYDAVSPEREPGLRLVASLAHPALGESMLDIGGGTGRLLQLLVDRAGTQQPGPSPSSMHDPRRSGPLVAVDVAELLESGIKSNLRQLNPAPQVSVCSADTLAAIIEKDRLQHPEPLSRGEARLYLGLGADILTPGLATHLVAKTPTGGFDLVTANDILTHASPDTHATLLGQWGSTLAPGGRLVVQRALYHPHPDAPLGRTCPGQLIFRQITRVPHVLRLVGHRQCAPDRLWVVCENQMRALATQAGFRVVQVAWASHGDHGAALGGGFAYTHWEDGFPPQMRNADHLVVDFLAMRLIEEQDRHHRRTCGKCAITYHPVSVVAELVKL